MTSPSELSLDCKPYSYSMLLKSFGEQNDQTQLRLEEYLARLEEERLKIDAFKRELPICMQLLTNALEASRQQLQAYRWNQGQKPVLEEFMPLKHSTSDNTDKAPNKSDKANWITSVQLWSQATNHETKRHSKTTSPKDTEIGFNASPKLALDTIYRNGGGAFSPFSKGRNSCPSPTLRSSLPDMALNSAENKEFEDRKCVDKENGMSRVMRGNPSEVTAMSEQEAQGACNYPDGQTTSTATTNSAPSTKAQPHRKARRCWSPDLHRRFVNALQMLGGAHVATPKQIRELMKVDGLTNDEVKSHLQKYRLHTRRPSPSPQAAGAHAPQLVVLGGIWVPPEYAAAATHGGAPTIYGAHASPHYCPSTMPQEFYTASPTPQPLPMTHHQFLHQHQLKVYNAASAAQNQSSPESDVRVTGEKSESSIEDGKSSESGRWKVERKKDVGDHESNGSEITLKF